MRIILFVFISLLSLQSIIAQNKVPKQYITIFGGPEWNTLSMTAGAEYEQALTFNGRNMLSIKTFAVLPYEYENFAFFSTTGYDGKAYRFGALLSGNFYMGGNKVAKGFYFTLGAGPGISAVKQKLYNYNGTYNYSTTTLLKLAAETGAGIEFGVGGNTHMRLSLTTRWGVFEGGYTAAQISIGL